MEMFRRGSASTRRSSWSPSSWSRSASSWSSAPRAPWPPTSTTSPFHFTFNQVGGAVAGLRPAPRPGRRRASPFYENNWLRLRPARTDLRPPGPLPGHARGGQHPPLDHPRRHPLPAVGAGQDQPDPLPGPSIVRLARRTHQRAQGLPAGRRPSWSPRSCSSCSSPTSARPLLTLACRRPAPLPRRRPLEELPRLGLVCRPRLRPLPPPSPTTASCGSWSSSPRTRTCSGPPTRSTSPSWPSARAGCSGPASARAPRSSLPALRPHRFHLRHHRRGDWACSGRWSSWACSPSSSGAAWSSRMKAPTYASQLIAAGMTFLLAIQALINISVVLGLGPAKGVPLPLLSFGRSSLVCSLLAVGILLHISQRKGEARGVLMRDAAGHHQRRRHGRTSLSRPRPRPRALRETGARPRDRPRRHRGGRPSGGSWPPRASASSPCAIEGLQGPRPEEPCAASSSCPPPSSSRCRLLRRLRPAPGHRRRRLQLGPDRPGWPRWLRLPTLILEQNVRPGFTNRLLARRADKAVVAFDATLPAFPGKGVLLGNPVRRGVLRPCRRKTRGPDGWPSSSSAAARAPASSTGPWPPPCRCWPVSPDRLDDRPPDRPGRSRGGRGRPTPRAASTGPWSSPISTTCRPASAGPTSSSAGPARRPAPSSSPPRKASLLVPFAGAAEDHQTANAESPAGRRRGRGHRREPKLTPAAPGRAHPPVPRPSRSARRPWRDRLARAARPDAAGRIAAPLPGPDERAEPRSAPWSRPTTASSNTST